MIDDRLSRGRGWWVLLPVIAACSGAPEQVSAPAASPPAPATAAEAPPPGPSAPAPLASAAAPSAPAEPPKAPEPPPSRCPPAMVEIAGGAFVSRTKQKTTLAPFCLDEDETTAEQYAACVKGGGCDEHAVKVCDGSTYGKEDLANHPMVCVDFPQAEAYCKAQKKRLPSTEEWEWAARAGAEGRLFPWGGDEPGDQMCWGGKAGTRKSTCAIGSFPGGANPQGVRDLAGSVYEWTTSASDKTSTGRYGHGGSWRDSARDLFRNDRAFVFKTTYRCGFLGIRCATTLE